MLSLYQWGQYGSARCSRTFKEAVLWISQFSFSFCPFQSMEVSQLWQELNSDVSVVLFISCQFVACQWKLLQQTSLPVNILASSREKRKGVKMLFFFLMLTFPALIGFLHFPETLCGSVRLNFTAYTDPISDMYLSSLGWRIALDEKLVEFRWVPQASQIHLHTNTHRCVTSVFGWFWHWEVLEFWMETRLTWCKLKATGSGRLRCETLCQLCSALSVLRVSNG